LATGSIGYHRVVAPGTNLGSPANRFVGRKAEADALANLVTRHRLVTVTGPPGVGKTRLAIEVAQGFGDRFDEIWFCDLAATATAADVLGVVVQTLGIIERSDADVIRLVSSELAHRGRILLLLDNAEHVVDAVAPLAADLAARTPECRILVTSREVLRASGETMFEVGALAPDEAVALFLERAASARPGYAPDGDEVAIVRELAAALDQLPLAIELAAARMRALGPRDVLAKLSRRFELLVDRGRGATGRQATLRSAIDWSWDLLPGSEQAVLAQCAVFATPFTPEAAEAIVRPPGGESVLDALQSLVDKSLLSFDVGPSGAGRYRLLVSIKQYAEEQLAALATKDAVGTRHAAYYLERNRAVVARFRSPAPREVWGDFDELLAVHHHAVAARDVRVALAAAATLAVYYQARGRAAELGAVLDDAIELARATPAEDREARRLLARAYLERGRARNTILHGLDGWGDLETARDLADDLGDRCIVGRARVLLGTRLFHDGRYAESRVELEETLVYIGEDDREARIVLLLILAHAEHQLGEPLAAHLHGEEAMRLAPAIDDPGLERHVANSLGALELQGGRLDEARRHLRRALELAREHGDRVAEPSTLYFLALAELDAGRPQAAGELAEEALAIGRRFGVGREAPWLLLVLAERFESESRTAEAIEAAESSLRLSQERSLTPVEAMAEARVAVFRARAGRFEEAKLAIDRAEARDLEDTIAAFVAAHAGLVHIELAGSERRAGRAAKAAAHETEARRRLAQAMPFAARAASVRIPVRSLEHAVAAGPVLRDREAPAPASPYELEEQGWWFQPPGQHRVSLDRRRSLRLLLARLIQQQRGTPGVAVPVLELFRAGWPGSDSDAELAIRRVHSAVWTLRRLGLRDLIVTIDDGYAFDRTLSIVIA
jgi:predicted ATPase